MSDPIDPLVKPDDPPARHPVVGMHARLHRSPYTMTYGLSSARTRLFCDSTEIAISGGYENAPAGWTLTTSTNSALPSEVMAANHWLFEMRGPMVLADVTVWFNVICIPRAR